MSIYLSPRGTKDDGIKCIVCHKTAAIQRPMYDMRIGFCDGESIDGSMVVAVVVAVHAGCLKGKIADGQARRL